jgi:hypothetical protein
MKTSELRKGNIIEWNKKPFNVCRIFEDAVENESWCKPIHELHPIPLTRDIFDKIESVRCEIRDFWLDEKLYLTEAYHLNSNKWFLATNSVYGGETLIGEPIEFLHELQNVVFALKKSELSINL